MPQFVILDHDYPIPHWDFLLESGEALLAWRLLAAPIRGRPIEAQPLPNHRRFYLEYEGAIHGHRGRVIRWDAGSFTWACDSSDVIRVYMAGGRVAGTVTLRRLGSGCWEWEWS